MNIPGYKPAKKTNLCKLRRSGRACYLMPWIADKTAQPWSNGYSRVFVPFTRSEEVNRRRPMFNSQQPDKKGHVQIVRNSSLDFNVIT